MTPMNFHIILCALLSAWTKAAIKARLFVEEQDCLSQNQKILLNFLESLKMLIQRVFNLKW